MKRGVRDWWLILPARSRCVTDERRSIYRCVFYIFILFRKNKIARESDGPERSVVQMSQTLERIAWAGCIVRITTTLGIFSDYDDINKREKKEIKRGWSIFFFFPQPYLCFRPSFGGASRAWSFGSFEMVLIPLCQSPKKTSQEINRL